MVGADEERGGAGAEGEGEMVDGEGHWDGRGDAQTLSRGHRPSP